MSGLTPPQSSTIPFAKLSSDAEVIVAPKTRTRSGTADRTQSKSIASAGHRSAGGRSGASNARSSSRREQAGKESVYLRPVDKDFCGEYFEPDNQEDALSLAAWVDRDVLYNKAFRGAEWICVSIVRPAGLNKPLDPQQQQKQGDLESTDAGKPATKVVARVLEWYDAPDAEHIAISSALCSALGVKGIAGGLARVESTPPPVPRNAINAINIFPFQPNEQQQSAGLRVGGDQMARDKATVARFKSLFDDADGSFLKGSLTDGLILPTSKSLIETVDWRGGLVRFDIAREVAATSAQDRQALAWICGSDMKAKIQLKQAIRNPVESSGLTSLQSDPISSQPPMLISIEAVVDRLFTHLSRCSSVLLTGGLGSGKSSIASLVAHRLRTSHLYYTSFFSCRKLVTDETRLSTIRNTISRLFMSASWGTRLGGRALVILDDLDKLCPVETELQVGNDNGRSRQISELISSIVRQYCSAGSGVLLLATAESKEALNNVIIGGHAVMEIMSLKAPNKDARKQVLQALAGKTVSKQLAMNVINGHSRNSSNGDGSAWLDSSPPASPSSSKPSEKIIADRTLDFLDIAGQTDGYMPGDLVLLVSRAKSESLIRSINQEPDTEDAALTLTKEDFQQALKGFTPASLRNVTLQSSKTSFDSIGGLHETRKILLETLQYPTTYAPIFAQCPLRLRSGLLLYGYPGCGKTLLASAVAGECGLNFISVKGPEILNKYIGASEKSVRDLFERAESAKPCVLFFDEFDSIAPKRGHDSTGVTDRVVNQLLTQMDGAEGLSGVYVLAATSRPDLIDPALLRPGRLDKSIICDLPDLDDRLDILRALSKTLKIDPRILSSKSRQQETLMEVAERTEGYSGADLQAVVYNAHLEAIHDVLDDKAKPSLAKEGKSRDDRKLYRSSTQKELIQFRYGDSIPPDTAPSYSKQLVDNAAILAKLDDLKAAKRKERQARQGRASSQGSSEKAAANEEPEGQPEVVIRWKHIEASLATTRSSISVEERLRLQRIYREFIGGRNGEMRSGEGPRDVGGRSSLM